MRDWNEFLAGISSHLSQLEAEGCDLPFFRGHSDIRWTLSCGLARRPLEEFKKNNLEGILYYDFMSQGGPLLGKSADAWDILFAMQHHGLPTRLLDWTTAFAPALYFAVKPFLDLREKIAPSSMVSQPCVWILDPFELNRRSNSHPAIVNPYTDLDGSYQENFIDRSKDFGSDVVAINPTPHAARQAAQRSVFTLHAELSTPLEVLYGDSVRRFELPEGSIHQAINFLRLAGVNEYSLFPDLDGLVRHLIGEHVLL